MALLELPASLLLLAPAGVQETPLDQDDLDFTAVDMLQVAAVLTQAGHSDAARYSVDVSQLLHVGRTRVYKGMLSIDGRRHAEIVCKIGHGRNCVESLHREASLYCGELASLQGEHVPTFIGLFNGETEGIETSCLVLSYEGERMQHSLYLSGIDFRKKVINTLCAVHKAGVHHGSFSEDSIIIRPDNSPLLVGFGSAEAHQCPLRAPIAFYAPQPHNQDVACEELYWASIVAAAWLPATVAFLNRRIPIQWALESFDALVARAPKGTDPDLACMHAELTREGLLEWIEERELLDGQPLPVRIVN